MGLDMYLYSQVYVPFTQVFPVNSNHEEKVLLDEDKPVLQWRKVNAIHNWFVNNVQNGEDDCGHYKVSKEKLHELMNTLEKIIQNPCLASSKLPTTPGFFFGPTNYDNYYFEELKRTFLILKEELAQNLDVEYFYHSSW